jgi:squalene cyclase
LSSRQRIDPRRIKIHLSYTVEDLALLLGCHKQSVRNWLKKGLEALDDGHRPLLIQGTVARAYLEARRRRAKQRCKPHELYCLSCRRPRAAAEKSLALTLMEVGSGMLSGLCSICETRMFKRVSAGAAVALGGQLEQLAEASGPTLKQAA